MVTDVGINEDNDDRSLLGLVDYGINEVKIIWYIKRTTRWQNN